LNEKHIINYQQGIELKSVT